MDFSDIEKLVNTIDRESFIMIIDIAMTPCWGAVLEQRESEDSIAQIKKGLAQIPGIPAWVLSKDDLIRYFVACGTKRMLSGS